MSTNQVKQQVRPEAKVKVINGNMQATGGISRKAVGVVGLYETADLPSASGVGCGVLAYNITTNKLQITVSGTWTDVA